MKLFRRISAVLIAALLMIPTAVQIHADDMDTTVSLRALPADEMPQWIDFSNSGLSVSNALTKEKWYYRRADRTVTDGDEFSGDIVFNFDSESPGEFEYNGETYNFGGANPVGAEFYIAWGGNYDKNRLTKNPPPEDLVKIEYLSGDGEWKMSEMSFSWSNTANKQAAKAEASSAAGGCVLIKGDVPSGETASKLRIYYNIRSRSDYAQVGNHNAPSISICAPMITYEKTRVTIEDSNYIAAGSTFAALFNTDMDASTVTPDGFSLSDGENEIPITDVAFGGRRAEFMLAENMKGKTKYTLTVKDSVRTSAGLPLQIDSVSFTTIGGYEEITFEDDMTGDGKYIEMYGAYGTYGNDFVPGKKLYRANSETTEMIWCFDGIKSTVQDGITYNFDGVVTSFQADYLRWGGYNITRDVSFYTSSDKTAWSPCTVTHKTNGSAGAEAPKSTSYISYGSLIIDSIPDGTRYIRAVMKNVTSANMGLMRPKFTYAIGSGVTFVNNVELDFNNEKTVVYLGTAANIRSEYITADKFSVSGESPESAVPSQDGRSIVLTFGSVLEFDTEYRLEITDIQNLNGIALEGTVFKTPVQPRRAGADKMTVDISDGRATVSTNVTFNYESGKKSIEVMFLTVVYSGDSIVSKSSDAKAITVGQTESFSNTVNFDSAAGQKLVSFILKSDGELYPLCDMQIYGE